MGFFKDLLSSPVVGAAIGYFTSGTGNLFWAAGGAAASSTYGGIESSKELAKQEAGRRAEAQRNQIRTQQRMADLKQQRERRQQVREARIIRARTIAAAQAKGVSGSTAEAGALGSITSQFAGGLSFLSKMGTLNEQGNIFALQASAATERFNLYQGRAQQNLAFAQMGLSFLPKIT